MAEKKDRWFGREFVIAFMGAAAAFVIPSLFVGFGTVLSFIWNALTARVGAPVWLLVMAGIVLLMSLGMNVRAAFRLPTSSSHLLYTEDTIFGVVWRWNYVGGKFDVVGEYCPKCDTRLLSEDYYGGPAGLAFRGQAPGTIFTCDHCHWRSEPFEGDYSDVLGRVSRQIDRKIRNKEWIKEILDKNAGRQH